MFTTLKNWAVPMAFGLAVTVIGVLLFERADRAAEFERRISQTKAAAKEQVEYLNDHRLASLNRQHAEALGCMWDSANGVRPRWSGFEGCPIPESTDDAKAHGDFARALAKFLRASRSYIAVENLADVPLTVKGVAGLLPDTSTRVHEQRWTLRKLAERYGDRFQTGDHDEDVREQLRRHFAKPKPPGNGIGPSM